MCDILHFQAGKGSLMEQLLDTAVSGKNRSEQNPLGESAFSAYGRLGLCGGRGVCGKCRLRFLSAAPLPSAADRRFFSPEELRGGWRLACTAKPAADCEAELHFEAKEILNEADILTETAQAAATGEGKIVQAAVTGEGKPAGKLCCVVDLGTTTVVMQLINKITGDILYTHAFLNPQRAYGIDVMARITNAVNMHSEPMQRVLLTELENGLSLLEKVGKPENIIISGNTTMEHLLLGYPVKGLGTAPFTPFSLDTARVDLFGYSALCLPGISAFVGADTVSGIYACHMAEQKELSLFIDLGTNGEIALGNRDRILCTATAAGSAFEGNISAQALGTDITALAYDMLQAGIMDENGLLAEPWFTEGYQAEISTAEGIKKVRICQQDIRSLQLAKAAICVGVMVLLDRMEAWERIAHVYLAGGFGYALDVKKAVGIGLIPAVLEDRCSAVGNTSLAGAIRYAREIDAEEELRHILKISQPLNLAQQPEFEGCYMDAMAFCRQQGLTACRKGIL